jgi:hypothetical protein
MEVMLAEVIALNAYSGRCLVSGLDDSMRIEAARNETELSTGQYIPTWYNRPWSEKIVICLS